MTASRCWCTSASTPSGWRARASRWTSRKDQRVEAGDLLAKVDLDAVKAAGYDTTTIVIVINTMAMTSVAPADAGEVVAGDPIIDVDPLRELP